MTRHLEIRIAIFAALIFVCATTSSAAAIAVHASRAHHRSQSFSETSQYTVSMTLPDPRPAVLASADRLNSNWKFDDLHGTTTVVRPQVQIVTQFRTRRETRHVAPDVRFSLTLKPGQRKVVSRGWPAVKQVEERVVLWDDVVIEQSIMSVHTVRDGKPDVIVEGAPMTWQQFASADRAAKLKGVYTMEATAYTAWTATAHPTGRTATGIEARYGVVAVDPRVIKLGTHVFVPGYGFAIAADTGGAIIGNRIDLCMESVRDALIFGRRTVKVYVLAR